MASKWKRTTLADVSSDISYGYTESATTEKLGPRFLRITDIQNGIVDWRTVPYCPITDNKRAKYLLQRGDIVVARTGNSTGENYIFDSEEEAVFASYLIRFKIAPDKAIPYFVWYSMRSPSWWAFVNTSKTGSAQAGANAKVLGRFPLHLPSLPEQQQIAHILGTLDDKIELNRQMNVTLEEMAKAIFKSWFIDFDPVHAKAQGRKPIGMSDEVAVLFPHCFEDTELGMIPKGWQISKLDNFIDFVKGKKPDISDKISPCAPHLLISVFNGNSSEMVSTTNMVVAEIDDILMVMDGASSGRVETGYRGVVGSTIAKITADPKLKSFLYFFLKRYEVDINSQTTGTSIPHTDKSLIRSLDICLPINELLEIFNSQQRAIRDKIILNKQQSFSLCTLRDTLLPKLLSGEISVKTAEKQIAKAL